MAVPKTGKASDGRLMHYSVGALIEKNGKFLLIDRATKPFGFAGIAGHEDKGETSEKALEREVLEEASLKVESMELLLEEEVPWNYCSKGVKVHYWKVFKCNASGEIERNIKEAKSIGWYNKEEIAKLKLEEVWKYWFEKIGILKP